MNRTIATSRNYYWLHTLIYFLLTFGIGKISYSALPPMGMSVIGIFLGLLYGWTFIGFIWPSMFSIFMLGVCGFFPSPQDAFAHAFSQQLVVFMLLVLVFTAYCEQSGLNKKCLVGF